MNIPCKDCICLPICKNIALEPASYTNFGFNVYLFSENVKCKLIEQSIESLMGNENWIKFKNKLIKILRINV